MRPRRFYSDIKPDSGHIEIVSEELFHLRKVLRSKPGDPIEIFNGKGKLFSGSWQELITSTNGSRSRTGPIDSHGNTVDLRKDG